MPGNERAELFAETAERKGIADAIVEKDFWVCWMLQQLFSIDAFAGRLLFKGGTSLSKVFHAITAYVATLQRSCCGESHSGERRFSKNSLSTTPCLFCLVSRSSAPRCLATSPQTKPRHTCFGLRGCKWCFLAYST